MSSSRCIVQSNSGEADLWFSECIISGRVSTPAANSFPIVGEHKLNLEWYQCAHTRS